MCIADTLKVMFNIRSDTYKQYKTSLGKCNLYICFALSTLVRRIAIYVYRVIVGTISNQLLLPLDGDSSDWLLGMDAVRDWKLRANPAPLEHADFQSLYQVAADVYRACKQKGASTLVVSLVSAQRRAFATYDLKVGNRLAEFKRYRYEVRVYSCGCAQNSGSCEGVSERRCYGASARCRQAQIDLEGSEENCEETRQRPWRRPCSACSAII